MSFFLGFYQDGELIMHHPTILRHYVFTWFGIDVLTVGPDWIFTGWGNASNEGQLVGIARLLRLRQEMRALRLLRMISLYMYSGTEGTTLSTASTGSS